MSNRVAEEPITCASCEYRYPPSEGICPMCGTELLRPLVVVRNKSIRARHKVRPASKDSQQKRLRPRLRRLIPVVAVVTALVTVTSFFYTNHNSPKESGGAAELAAPSAQPKVENASQRHIVHNPVRGVQQFVARKFRAAQTIAAKETDPVELWKAVKRGKVSAEVALANLYLEGEAVSQNCEQAHMLLSAASVKGSKTADDLLKSSYAE